ncbi:MAG: nucleotidyl transferase AbiEii/AbiGii toxin family protein [Candidatus Omnitrophica bacterium]|nr:nucleotidyl transferase AbiEii/AbiGii toxin family protein [Candidatus Omnitrophota bacterium]
MDSKLFHIQKRVLKIVRDAEYPVYLVGGTALAMYFHHRPSEDLDFFTHRWTPNLHRTMVARVRRVTGFRSTLMGASHHPQWLNIAVYNLFAGNAGPLKIDIVEDRDSLLQPLHPDGRASLDDLYLRKLRAVIGWPGKHSVVGKPIPGGREAAKDMFDLWCLSTRYRPLAEYFASHFGQDDYGRLAGWLRTMSHHAMVTGLLAVKPGCDTRAIRTHLEQQILHRLNRVYVPS